MSRTHEDDIQAEVSADRPRQRRRARGRRLRVRRSARVRARGLHPDLGVLEGDVDDASVRGLGVSIDEVALKGRPGAGEALEDLEVMGDGGTLFFGRATIRHVDDAGGRLRLGLRLEGDTVDMAVLALLDERERLARAADVVDEAARRPGVEAPFVAWVASMRHYLETWRRFLAREEEELLSLDLEGREVARALLLEECGERIVSRMERARDELGRLVEGLPEEAHRAYAAYLRDELAALLVASPFIRRALGKPLGYAGDYELMNMLYRDGDEGETVFGQALQRYATGELAARANVNRLYLLADRIEQAAKERGEERVRVMSVGAGPARELSLLLGRAPWLGPRLAVTLVDQEERALAFIERTLGPLAGALDVELRLVHEEVTQLLRGARARLGAFDLVYSAGLFDYVSDRLFPLLLRALWSTVDDGGRLLVGNVSPENPSRRVMEYYGDWHLVHRGREQLLAFAAPLSPAPACARVEAEPLGINLFLSLSR